MSCSCAWGGLLSFRGRHLSLPHEGWRLHTGVEDRDSRNSARRSAPHAATITSRLMVVVILESGLLTRPFTLFSSPGLCKTPLYGIWTKKAFTMNGLQDG